MKAGSAARGLTSLSLLLACGCRPAPPPDAIDWLLAQPTADGLWTGSNYGVLAHGESVTATIALALALDPRPDERRADLLGAALAALAAREAPSPPRDGAAIDYPVYTAGCLLHALAIVRPPDWSTQRDRLITWLRVHQLVEANGFAATDPAHGGFGLGDRRPQAPAGADLVGLSATTCVLEAAAAAGVPTTDPLVIAARGFVERCQNLPGDGGFHFAPTLDWRAGKAGIDAGSAHSYGTATADGVRALRAAGLPPDHERLAAGMRWLQQHARPSPVPGFPTGDPIEPGLRCYWLQSWARTLSLLPGTEPGSARRLIAAALAGFAQPDGSHRSPAGNMKEDDPLVATALALLAEAALAQPTPSAAPTEPSGR